MQSEIESALMQWITQCRRDYKLEGSVGGGESGLQTYFSDMLCTMLQPALVAYEVTEIHIYYIIL